VDKLLFLDLESTGVYADKNSILQIYAEYHENGEKKKEFNQYVKLEEGDDISLEALKINHTSIKDLYSQGRKSEKEAIYEFVDWLLTLPIDIRDPITMVGHNVHFDRLFIIEKLKKYNFTQMDRIFSYRIEDTLSMGRYAQKIGLIAEDKLSLKTLAKTLGVIVKEKRLHDAKYDIAITAEVYYKLLDLGKTMVDLAGIGLKSKKVVDGVDNMIEEALKELDGEEHEQKNNAG